MFGKLENFRGFGFYGFTAKKGDSVGGGGNGGDNDGDDEILLVRQRVTRRRLPCMREASRACISFCMIRCVGRCHGDKFVGMVAK